MPEDFTEISEATFKRWIRAPDVLNLLLPTLYLTSTIISALQRRIHTEDVILVARKVTWLDGTHREVRRFFRLPLRWCKDATVFNTQSDFWVIGDMTIQTELRHGSRTKIDLLDVRFSPGGVRRLAVHDTQYGDTPDALVTRMPTPIPTPPEPPAPAPKPPDVKATGNPRNGRLKIDPKVLKDWIATYGAANPDASFEVFLTNARLKFPHLWVTERPVQAAIADLGLEKKRGNPTIPRK